MQFRTAAALAYELAIEISLAVSATWSTWYALRRIRFPGFLMGMLLKRQMRPARA
jgi:hypothetical protein